MKLRASSMDRFLACPTSEQPVDHPFNPPSPEAALGTAKHAAIEAWVKNEEDQCDEIAHEAGVDHDDLRAALGAARKLYAEILTWYPGMRVVRECEVPLETESSKGTSDLVVLFYEQGTETPPYATVVVDHKTGFSEDEHRYQLVTYAEGARRKWGMPSCGYITTVEGQLRHGERIVRNYTAEDLIVFSEKVARAQSRIGTKIVPGKHCGFCPRQLVCEERTAYLRASTEALVAVPPGPITAVQIGAIYDRYKEVMRAADRYQKLVDAALEQGPIPLPGGRRLELHEVERTVIDPKAIAVLTQTGWTTDELRSAVRVSKTGLNEIAKAKAPPRGGARLMRQVMTELEKGSALRTETRREKVIIEAEAMEPAREGSEIDLLDALKASIAAGEKAQP